MREQPHLSKTRQAVNATMPLDKQTNGKPITPALSSKFRANTKSPLTPRLVRSGASSPASSTRREVLIRTRSPAREPIAATPFDGNITPRTAARRSRIGTNSPTTPGTNQTAAIAGPIAVSGAAPTPAQISRTGLGISSPSSQARSAPPPLATSAISPTPICPVYRRFSGAKSAVQARDEVDSQFFRADDVKSYVPERPAASTDPTSFFFVGSTDVQSSLSSNPSPTQVVQTDLDEKFFHADDVRSQTKLKPPSRPALPSKSETFSAPGYAARSQQVDAARPKVTASPSSSPVKFQAAGTRPNSPRKEATRKILSPANPAQKQADRRDSVGSGLSIRRIDPHPDHQESLGPNSTSGAFPTLDQRVTEPLSVSAIIHDRPVASPTSPQTSNAKAVQTCMLTASTEPSIAARTRAFSGPTIYPTAVSPISDTFPEPSQKSSTRPQHDAANARRERKVLDLEISNSSLLAINKTLEKELRKQNTELRRFRRLSRSGRLSLAPTTRSISASMLGTVAEGEGNDSGPSDPDHESDLDTLDDDETDILSNDSSSVHSPTSRARQRARDERRLMLDLSKHQQMLLDSQKLTQSIRRCLTCTEELIKDGNKALEYRVGIGDIQLGGRVLDREEIDHNQSDDTAEGMEQRRGLLSPTVTLSQLEEATLLLTSGVGSRSEQPDSVNGRLDAINTELDAL